MARSAEDVSEQIAGLMEEFEQRLRNETRADCADALLERFVDRSGSVVTYTDTPADSIIDMLREATSLKRRAFAGLADRFDDNGVPLDFRLGIQFCVYLLKDPKFEL